VCLLLHGLASSKVATSRAYKIRTTNLHVHFSSAQHPLCSRIVAYCSIKILAHGAGWRASYMVTKYKLQPAFGCQSELG